jgi:hypothetical protein
MLNKILIALAFFIGQGSEANSASQTYRSSYNCGTTKIYVDSYAEQVGSCTLWLSNQSYVYGPRCDDSVRDETPWVNYGIIFSREGLLSSFNGATCKKI